MNLQNLTDVQLGDEIELTERIICFQEASWQIKHNQYQLLKQYWQEESRRGYGR